MISEMWRTRFPKRIMALAKDFWSWIIGPWSDLQWVLLVFFEIGISIAILAPFWDRFLRNPSLGETLRNTGLLVAAVVAATLAVWRSKVGERQVRLAQQRLFEERHQKGTEMLGHALLSVRLGGIYALKHLAQEEPKQFHLRTIRQFCAFVLHPPDNKDEDSLVKGSSQEAFNSQTLREDFQAIMEAIRTRSTACIETEREQGFRLRLPGANLAGAILQGAILQDAKLPGANLAGANLAGAELPGAELRAANLEGAFLAGAELPGAELAGANLVGAHLEGAHLASANLSSANLAGAHLEDADLAGADLKGANLGAANFDGDSRLTQTQLDRATGDPRLGPPKLANAIDHDTGKPLHWGANTPE